MRTRFWECPGRVGGLELVLKKKSNEVALDKV